MSIGIVIQARTGSKRLPGKMILPFHEGKGILEIVLERLVKSNIQIPIIVATTIQKKDNEIEEIAKKLDVTVFRGDEEDVLKRFIDVAEKFNLDKIIRLCADNPFIDIEALQFQVNAFINSDSIDYCCYSTSDKTPTIKTHYGFWTEGVKSKCLKQIAALTSEKVYHEHVTNYIYSHPELFEIQFNEIHETVENSKNIRLTVDTINDYNLAREIYSELLKRNVPFNAVDIVNFVRANDAWLNSMQKEITSNTK